MPYHFWVYPYYVSSVHAQSFKRSIQYNFAHSPELEIASYRTKLMGKNSIHKIFKTGSVIL